MDITSSGLTHTWENFPGEENPYRVGEVFTGLGYGLLKIDWSGQSPAVQLEIRDPENQVHSEFRVAF